MTFQNKIAALIAMGIFGLILNASLFTIKEYEMGLRLQLGEIVDSNYNPGLHFKIPVIQNVDKFDKRIQTLDLKAERFLTVEKKFVVVDSFAKWRIKDVAQYYRSTKGSAQTTERLLSARINAALRDEFGKRTIQEVVSGERTEIMKKLSESANTSAKDLGVTIVDIRVKQIDFEESISDTIYERMRTERQRVASELRAQGAEAAEKIQADAERQKTEILSVSYRDGELIRGEGDAEAAQIYSKEFEKDKDFYSFWRSLKAYREVFEQGDSMMVLDPKSDFFKHFDIKQK